MKRLMLCVLLLIVAMSLAPFRARSQAGAAGARTAEYVPAARFDPARDAAADIRGGVAEARRTGRRELLDVGGEWCIWCRRLDTLFTVHTELEKFREAHFVVVKVNWSPENKNESVLSRYPPVRGYPHLFVLENDGTLLYSEDTGELEKGKGHDPDRVMAFLRAWAPKD